MLAAPLVRLSSSLTIGRRLRQRGLLLVPSETTPPTVLQELTLPTPVEGDAEPAPPPVEHPRDMPLQSFSRDWARRLPAQGQGIGK